jgi:hypothetical protein
MLVKTTLAQPYEFEATSPLALALAVLNLRTTHAQ